MLSGARGLMGTAEQPCRLLYVAMFNPAFAGGSEQEFMRQQLVFYINFEDRQVSEDEQLKTIGIVQGINDFGAKFDGASQVSHIDTDRSRLVMCNVEADYWLCMAVEFAVVGTEHTPRGLAPPEVLRSALLESYGLWRLNHGPLEGHEPSELEAWWQRWCEGRFATPDAFNISHLGFMGLYPAYKQSSMRLPVSFKANIDIRVEQFLPETGARGLCVLNTNRFPFKNFGLVYHSHIEPASLVSLVQYLEATDLVVGLTPDVLAADNFPMAQEPSFFERSLIAPTFETLNTVFSPVSMTLDAVSTLTSLTTKMIPAQLSFWGAAEAAPEPAPEPPALEGKYLATAKTVHLDTQHRLVLYEVCGLMFCLLFDPDDSPELAALEAKLKELYRVYLSDLALQQVKDMEAEQAKSPFYYMLYDRQRHSYESSFPAIPEPDSPGPLSRAQTLHLHNCIIGFVLRNGQDAGLRERGRLFKTGKNWWVVETSVGGRELVIARRFEPRDARRLRVLDGDQTPLAGALGADVLAWFEQLAP